MVSPLAGSVAVRRNPLGEGAERVVFKLREVGVGWVRLFVGPEMVAKESKFYEDLTMQQKDKFLSVFADTQQRAAELAEAFNERIAALPGGHQLLLPRIRFLDCAVYTVLQPDMINFRWLLAEEKLDTAKYKKWNNNAGFVQDDSTPFPVMPPPPLRVGHHGTVAATAIHATVRLPPTVHAPVALPRDRQLALEAIAEGALDGEHDGEDCDDPEALATVDRSSQLRGISALGPSEVAQAFSHFSFRYSRRKFLVCDLQGVYEEGHPPVLVFTDPVIHCASAKRCTYGRTDHGKKGQRNFFKTHKCNALCELLKQGYSDRRQRDWQM
eukprot:CAMPEP_0175897236 /NCGR_PEP_ID=MMETSP0108-20121206/606_1 /TAXON_ID=195067 ORGANISM="Goniomonas pacifica, Strain CCMP1869" /NCGR_SAMPLE_ID=MMETSP0108 /ASSEMBLY_ACC=CAM_ASM_000204 /LENGTH=325 /DNA_ID=CAMNT_0017218509 /DNA_START=31 /DNA_END=1008 /DNA_ORIENTATION=-